MKRAVVYKMSAAAIAAALPTVANAQTPPDPRDGKVEQAVQDTIGANIKRRGYANTDPKAIATHVAVRNTITNLTNSGGTANGTAAASRTWADTIKGLITDLTSGFTWPLSIGKSGTKPFEGGGTFGGGGATGSWDVDCDDIEIKFDVSGNLIIPSYSLDVGKPFYSLGPSATAMYRDFGRGRGHNAQSALRWRIHKEINAVLEPKDHYGIVSQSGDCAAIATVAYRNELNQIVPRATSTQCVAPAPLWVSGSQSHSVNGSPANPQWDINCPINSNVGGDFHFYGDGDGWGSLHNHGCTAYAPNPLIGEGGYYINPKTTIPFNGTSFAAIPAGWKGCLTDRAFLRRLSDGIAKIATKTTGTLPYSPITDTDVRGDDTTVNDLNDKPIDGTRPDPNPTTVDTPPAPPPSPPPSVSVDLGTDPNIGTPSDPEAPTNIMDPVFDWLPDLPSIQLNTAGAQCPTWEMQPFEGPEWHLVMDKHCPFIADNAALISTIMILGFTVGSAMIILRA